MEKKQLIEVCEKVLKDLKKRTEEPWRFGEDWDVSYDSICEGKYILEIRIIDCDKFSEISGKKPSFNFKLMNNETCTFVVDENKVETFVEKSLVIINK